MKQLIRKPMGIKIFIATLLTGVFAFTEVRGGRDSYEIYINKKLVMKEYVGITSASLLNVPLEGVSASDQLVVYYSHCGRIGKGRNITITDEQNRVVKEWKFADATGTDAPMVIPVKELLELKKKYPDAKLSLSYASADLMPKAMMLAALNPSPKKLSGISSSSEILLTKASLLVSVADERR